MATTTVLKSFKQCIDSAIGKKHVLLGNGFSRACRNQVFSYDSLFKSADFSKLTAEAKRVFDVLGTTDFEIAMKSLNNSSAIMPLYGCAQESSQKAKADADALRNVLVNTIAKHHPPLPSSITEQEYSKCIDFLSHFEKIYSLNYDLLLYWTLMKLKEKGKDQRDDGFRDPWSESEEDEYEEENYVAWTNDRHTQDVYYIHGALHIFYRRALLQKYCWSRTGTRLLDQIDSALKSGKFPLIVAEGTADQKLERIQKSNYLGHNLRSLRSVTGTLFIYGLSFGENDSHIIKQIQKNHSLKKICVSIYGAPDNTENKSLVEIVTTLASNRPDRKPLQIDFYDASSARVWS